MIEDREFHGYFESSAIPHDTRDACNVSLHQVCFIHLNNSVLFLKGVETHWMRLYDGEVKNFMVTLTRRSPHYNWDACNAFLHQVCFIHINNSVLFLKGVETHWMRLYDWASRVSWLLWIQRHPVWYPRRMQYVFTMKQRKIYGYSNPAFSASFRAAFNVIRIFVKIRNL